MSQDNNSVSEVEAHEEASILLPWYANGTLAPSERQHVSSHLASCAGCRKALAEFQRVQTLWQHDDSVPFEMESGLARLLNMIDQSEHREVTAGGPPPEAVSNGPEKQSRRSGLGTRLLAWLHGGADPDHFGLKLASMAGAALIALVTLRPWGGLETGAFRTLGSSESADSPARRDLRVVFTPSSNIQRVIESLAAVNGRIIDGPTQLGVFTVRLEATTGEEEPLASLVARLRENPAIVLAEPAAP